MAIITIEYYEIAKIFTVKVGNKTLFWVKMCDVQEAMGLKI